MNRKIRISLVGTDLSATADLLDDINRAACDLLWRNVPYRSTLYHTLVSGKNAYTFLPEVAPVFDHAPALARRMDEGPGTIFIPYPRCMFVKYGRDSEDRSFPPVARVAAGDLPRIEEMGRRAWDSMYRSKEPLTIAVTRVGDARPPEALAARLLAPSSFADPGVAALVADMNAEIERIWLDPPEEVLALHSGRHSAETGLGSYGQYFTTLLFAEKETSRISNIANSGAIDNLLRLCHQTDADLAVLKAATKIFCGGQIEFLRLCGQRTFAGLFHRAVALFDRISSKAEYSRLFATYALYATRYNAWQLHRFPWSVGHGHAYGATDHAPSHTP
jgi:hypothetical protein